MAELADAQDSESCGVTPVEVQLLFPAPTADTLRSPSSDFSSNAQRASWHASHFRRRLPRTACVSLLF